LGSKTPLQAMKDWHKLEPKLFKQQPYNRPGCDRYPQLHDLCIKLANGHLAKEIGALMPWA